MRHFLLKPQALKCFFLFVITYLRTRETVKVRQQSLVTLIFSPRFKWPLTHSEPQTDHYLCSRAVWALNDLCCCFLSCWKTQWPDVLKWPLAVPCNELADCRAARSQKVFKVLWDWGLNTVVWAFSFKHTCLTWQLTSSQLYTKGLITFLYMQEERKADLHVSSFKPPNVLLWPCFKWLCKAQTIWACAHTQ